MNLALGMAIRSLSNARLIEPCLLAVPSATAQPGPSRLPRQRVQDVDRIAHVQGLSEPPRSRRARVNAEPLRLVPRPQRLHGISGYRSRRRHLGQELPIRAPELEHAVG